MSLDVLLDANYEWLEYVIFQSHGKVFFPLRKSGKALGMTLGVVLAQTSANFLEEFKITGFLECVELDSYSFFLPYKTEKANCMLVHILNPA